MKLPEFPGFKPDHGDLESVHELSWKTDALRIERMNDRHYWLRATDRRTGRDVHVDIVYDKLTKRIRIVPRHRL